MKKTEFAFVVQNEFGLIEEDKRALLAIENPQIQSVKKEPPQIHTSSPSAINIGNQPRNMLSTEQIKNITVERMNKLGVYHESFEDLIHIYANMIYEYEQCRDLFVMGGSEYETETAAGGSKKSGFVSAMEVLRKDIGTYSDRLQLNPKARGLTTDSIDTSSPIETFLLNFGSGGSS